MPFYGLLLLITINCEMLKKCRSKASSSTWILFLRSWKRKNVENRKTISHCCIFHLKCRWMWIRWMQHECSFCICTMYIVHIERIKEMREIQLGLWVLMVIDKRVCAYFFESPKFGSFQVDRNNSNSKKCSMHTYTHWMGGFCDKNWLE